jgi:hypothetical protein
MRRRTLIRAGDDIRVIRGSILLKKFQKFQEKACQPLASSARPDLRATNSSVWPFKKSSKKVKKKLVRPLEIY